MELQRVGFTPLFDEALQFVNRCIDSDTTTLIPRTLYEILLAEDAAVATTGDQCLADIRDNLAWLDAHGHQRSPQQRELQEAFLMATAKIIYRDEFDDNVERIMNANGWEKLYQEVLIGTPRRFGKTTPLRCLRVCFSLRFLTLRFAFTVRGRQLPQWSWTISVRFSTSCHARLTSRY